MSRNKQEQKKKMKKKKCFSGMRWWRLESNGGWKNKCIIVRKETKRQ
jgi:hypothetical protein